MFSTVDLPKNPWIVSRSVEQWVPWALTNAARRSPWLGTHQGPEDESTVVLTKVYQETTVEFYSQAMSGCQFFEWARKEWTSERKFLVSRWFPFLWTRNHGVCNSRGAPVIFFGQGPCGQGSEFLFSKFAVHWYGKSSSWRFLVGFTTSVHIWCGRWCGQLLKELTIQP